MICVNKFGKANSITLDNGIISAEVLSFGAALRSLFVPDKDGSIVDVCLGYDSLDEYKTNDGYIGAVVGRFANRIGNSCFTLDGIKYRLTPNEGKNQLHGGPEGFSHRIWDFETGESSVTFAFFSPSGDQGFPGNMQVWVKYSLDGSSLRIDYRAASDADTIVNLTNHTYFNLSGHNSGAVYDHELWINADRYTPFGPGLIPTGELASVEGTVLDFRSSTSLEQILNKPELGSTNGLDHNFVLNGRDAARLCSPASGIMLRVETDLEGMQVYSGGCLSCRTGKNGAIYSKHHAVCLETQHFPDSINKPGFPSPILRAGDEFSSSTVFDFSIK